MTPGRWQTSQMDAPTSVHSLFLSSCATFAETKWQSPSDRNGQGGGGNLFLSRLDTLQGAEQEPQRGKMPAPTGMTSGGRRK